MAEDRNTEKKTGTKDPAALPIGVFDSGVGGISVLREMVKIMPEEDFIFFGDSKNAPYGTKTTEEVRALTISHVEDFLREGVKAVAIACNTATSAAVKTLRTMYPDLPLVGIEPAVKPAVEAYPGGRILVMATPMTVHGEKFHRLIDRFSDRAEIIPLPCPGLMEYVERGWTRTEELEEFLRQLLWEYIENPVDAVVLGCTHYPFIAKKIEKVLGSGPEIFDGGPGTAREMKRRIEEAGLARHDPSYIGSVTLRNSNPTPEKMTLSRKLLALPEE